MMRARHRFAALFSRSIRSLLKRMPLGLGRRLLYGDILSPLYRFCRRRYLNWADG